MKDDVLEFVGNCIHFMMAKYRLKIPRPISETTHAVAPNDVIHSDFLYMGAGADGYKYLLALKEELSGYVWLVKAETTDVATAYSALSKWIRTFTAMNIWVSDQGSNFKSDVMQILASDYNIPHEFVVAYSPWANDTVKNVNKHVMRATRALCT